MLCNISYRPLSRELILSDEALSQPPAIQNTRWVDAKLGISHDRDQDRERSRTGQGVGVIDGVRESVDSRARDRDRVADAGKFRGVIYIELWWIFLYTGILVYWWRLVSYLVVH